MARDADQPKGWRGDKNQPKREKRYGWKPTKPGLQTPWLMRRGTQLSLGLGIMALFAVIVAMIYYLRPPLKASIIVVGANPNDVATQLSTPLDFHGWAGAKKLATFLNEKDRKILGDHAQCLPENGTPVSLTDRSLREDLADLVKTKSEQVIIYFGLIGFAIDDKPYLFGAKGEKIAVQTIVEMMGNIAREKEKNIILLFDGARLAVAPELGLLHNDFARALDKLCSSSNSLNERLAIINSSSAGERAWNSDEWNCSAFVVQLLQTFSAPSKPDGKHDIKLDSFFNDLKKNTVKWTGERYISVQTPQLWGGGKQNMKVVTQNQEPKWLNPEDKGNAPGIGTLNAAKLEKLKTYLNSTIDLAIKKPSPAVYTPLAWRRSRELLVRLEQALRMQDEETAGKITSELDKLYARITEAQGFKFKHVTDSNTIWNRVFDAGKQPKTVEAILKEASERTDAPQDAEGHLAFMLNKFWNGGSEGKNLKPALQPLVKDAIVIRQLAERAALVCPNANSGHPYTEYVWRLVEPRIKALDQDRRLSEDYLFTDEYAQAGPRQIKVKAGYEMLLQQCLPLQEALGEYHQAVSEATFLTLWHVHTAEEPDAQKKDQVQGMTVLWKKIHDLHRKIIALTTLDSSETLSELKTLTSEVRDKMKLEMGKLDQVITAKAGMEANSITQIPKHHLELLLNAPWPLPNDRTEAEKWANLRMDAIVKVRQAGDRMAKDVAVFKPENKTSPWKEIVEYRADLLLTMLDDMNTHANDKQRDMNNLREQAEWATEANKLGKKLKEEWEILDADNTSKSGRTPPLKDTDAEKYSRFTLKYTEVTREPAEEQRRKQWTKLLQDQALRVCQDHWYEKEKEAYYKTVAQLYLNEASELNGPDVKLTLSPELDQLRQLPPLQWKNSSTRITWTSEQEMQREMELVNSFGGKIDGRVSLWVDEEGKGQEGTAAKKPAVELDEKSRVKTAIELAANKSIQRKIFLRAGDLSQSELSEQALTFKPKAYFRGQEPTSTLQAVVNRKPSLIVTEHEHDQTSSFTLTTAKDLRIGLGHLAIVLDYSGSMRTSKVRDPNNKNDYLWTDDSSRIRQAINGLETMLSGLSERVDHFNVSIRIFSEKDERSPKNPPDLKDENDPGYDQSVIDQTDAIQSKRLFNGSIQRKDGRCVYVPSDKPEQSRSLHDIMNELRKIQPFWSTPLLKSMKDAKDKDTVEAIKNGESVTLLVLTDGADTSLGNIKATNDPRVNELRNKFQREFEGSDLLVQMVLFDATEIESNIAEAQFKDWGSRRCRVSFKKATNPKELIDELLASFKIRMQLLDSEGKELKSKEPDNRYFTAEEADPPYDQRKFTSLLSGEYRASVWSKDKQLLSFKGGDHLFIKLVNPLNDTNNKVSYTRELFADVWKKQSKDSLFFQAGKWHVAIPDSKQEGIKRGKLLVTMEDGGRLDSSTGTTPELSMPRPKFVWWELKPASETVKELAGTIQITNRPYYLAPAWDIEKSPNQEENVRLQAWVIDQSLEEEVLRPFTRKELKDSNNFLKLNELTTVSVESHSLLNSCTEPTSTKETCLVVRYRMPANQSIQKQPIMIKTAGLRKQREDHHYFHSANTLTYYLSPFNVEVDSGTDITIKLVKLGEHLSRQDKPTISAVVPMNQNWNGPPVPVSNK